MKGNNMERSEAEVKAIRVTVGGNLSYRTMYPIIDATLTHYIDTSHAWKVEYNEEGTPQVIDRSNNG